MGMTDKNRMGSGSSASVSFAMADQGIPQFTATPKLSE